MSNGSRPGEWPSIGPKEYQRLIRLAKRRLAGNDHLAEDVVQRAIIKWTAVPAPNERARIEQVVKTEASSVLRSERRTRARETRVAFDPGLSTGTDGTQQSERELQLLRIALAQAAVRESIPLTSIDIEILELLFAGSTITETMRVTGLSGSAVRRSRSTWQQIVLRVLNDEN